MIELIVESANSRDRVPLPEDGVVGVGTDSKCAVQIQDSDVARMHCVLRGAEGRWTVENCESSSGTWVNDDEIRRRELVPGDVIRIGTTRITVSEANAESPAAPPRPKSPAGPAPTPSASTKGAATRGAAAPNSARGKAARPAPSRGPAPKRRPRPKSGGTHPAILVAIGLVTLVLGFVVVKEATREPVQKRDRELSQDEKPKRRKKTKRSLSEAERLRQRRLAREIPEEDSQDDEQEQQKENERSLEEADANAAKPVAKRVDGLIAEGKLRDASDALAAFTRDHTYDITLAPQRRALERAVRELVTKARGEVEALSKNGKQVEANAVLDNLETALPEDQADRVLALRDELDEAFRERNARLRDVDKAKLSIARALADLD
ncbi:MAG: FHA domain-containing protein, partial [Planctomycetota bacterium]